MSPFNFLSWPKKPKPWDWDAPGTNRKLICFLNRQTGLSYWTDDKNISVDLKHPMAKYWLSILQPYYAKKNKGRCPVCRGSGWDGESYILSCMKCGGTGKIVDSN